MRLNRVFFLAFFIFLAFLLVSCIGGGSNQTNSTGGINSSPQINSFTAEPSTGTVPLTVKFSWSIFDPEGDSLTCYIDVDNDGTNDHTVENCNNNSTFEYTYSAVGNYTAKLTVVDENGNTVNKTVFIKVENSVDLSKGLVAYWSFDNCDARDDSGNGNDGEISGNLKCVNGIKGKGFYFDGNSWIDVGKTSILASALESQSFTIFLCFNPEKIDNTNVDNDMYGDHGDKGIIVFWDDDTQSGGDRWIKIDDGKVYFNGYEDPTIGGAEVISNNWYCIAYVSDKENNKSYFYVNGGLVDEKDEPAYPHTGRTFVSLGAGHYGYIWDWDGIPDGDRFKGVLDEIRIYNKPLNEEEIKLLFQMTNSTIISLSADPSSGELPLMVTFNCELKEGELVKEYRWDFDGDGNIDEITTEGTVTYTYNDVGKYKAKVTVIDDAGNKIESEVMINVMSPYTEAYRYVVIDLSNHPYTFISDCNEDEKIEIFYPWYFEGKGIENLTRCTCGIINSCDYYSFRTLGSYAQRKERYKEIFKELLLQTNLGIESNSAISSLLENIENKEWPIETLLDVLEKFAEFSEETSKLPKSFCEGVSSFVKDIKEVSNTVNGMDFLLTVNKVLTRALLLSALDKGLVEWRIEVLEKLLKKINPQDKAIKDAFKEAKKEVEGILQNITKSWIDAITSSTSLGDILGYAEFLGEIAGLLTNVPSGVNLAIFTISIVTNDILPYWNVLQDDVLTGNLIKVGIGCAGENGSCLIPDAPLNINDTDIESLIKTELKYYLAWLHLKYAISVSKGDTFLQQLAIQIFANSNDRQQYVTYAECLLSGSCIAQEFQNIEGKYIDEGIEETVQKYDSLILSTILNRFENME